MNLTEIKVGSPYLWKSAMYGDVAVHVASIYNGIIKVTVDGGESARQVIDYPELNGGWFVIPERLHKRASKARKTGIGRVEVPAEVTNTIRDVSGIGKVAIVTTEPRVSRAQMMREARQTPAFIEAAKGTVDEPKSDGKLTKKDDIIVAIQSMEAKTDDQPKTTTQRNKRRMSLTQALNVAREMADRNHTHFKWVQSSTVEEF